MLQTDSDVTMVCTTLQNVLAGASSIDTVILPTIVRQPSWNLAWLECVPGLKHLDLRGTSFRKLKSCGLRMSALSEIRTVHVKLTEDAPSQHKHHLVFLREVTVSFGHGEHAPSAANLADLLHACTHITKLHFTFAKSFTASKQLMEAMADLSGLKDLQINSFNITELAAVDLVCMSQLACLEQLELSGMHDIGERCAR